MGNFISFIAPYQRSTAIAFVGGVIAAAHFFPSTSDTSSVINIVHLGSFGLWFGIQFWVSFVAGLTKLRILPRHWFGKVQSALFHRYFVGGMLLNATMTSTFLMLHPWSSWKDENLYMGYGLLLNGAITCLNSLYVEPHITSIMNEMHKYEKDKGHGDEIGPIKSGTILEDPKYQSMRKQFMKFHGLSSLMNLASFVTSGVHLCFLANRIKI